MPSALDTPQGAAESLLPPFGNRWLHAQAVAVRAVEASEALPENERGLLVGAAWPILLASGSSRLQGRPARLRLPTHRVSAS
jgi:hypothetical protein